MNLELCTAIGVVLITLTVIGLVALLAKLLKPRVEPPSARPMLDDFARADEVISDLFRSNLIDAATYQRVIQALRLARAKREPAPIPALPIAPLAPAIAPPPIARPAPQPVAEKPIVRHRSVQPIARPALSVPQPFPNPPPKPVTPPPPKQALSDVLAGFMRESNIRWGELVGGMLIIGCSVALVVSFWSQIAHHSFLQFGIFTTVTTAMLGLGLYAEHRWKLPTTSRGILLIATLLVPLNFLAFAALSHGVTPSLLETATEIGVLAFFGFLVWKAAIVLSPQWPKVLAIGMVGISASLPMIQRFGPAQSTLALHALAGIPLIVYGAAIGLMLNRAAHWKEVHGHAAEAMFLLLGELTFGTSMGIGLVVFQTHDAWDSAHRLATLLSLAATPALATGLLIWQRARGARFGRARTTGTAIAIGAAFWMLGAIGLAWPDASSIIPLALADFVALSCVAVFFEIPAVHALAAFCLLLAYLVGFHVTWGHIGWHGSEPEMLRSLIAPSGGAALIPLFALTVAAAGLLQRLRRTSDAMIYGHFAIVVALLSLALASHGSFTRGGDLYGATWVYGFYSAIGFAVAFRERRERFGWAASLLLLAACAQFFVARTNATFPWSTSLLAGSSLLCITALCLRRTPALAGLREPLRWTAMMAASAAVMLLVAESSIANSGPIGHRLLWTCAIGFALALADEWEALLVATQMLLAVALVSETVAVLSGRDWFAQLRVPLLDPWTLESLGAVLAVLALVFSLARLLLPQKLWVGRCLRSAWAFDKSLIAILAAGLGILVVVATVHGIADEFAPPAAQRAFASWDSHVAGAGSWMVLATLLLAVTAWIAAGAESTGLVLWLILAALACCLAAVSWAPQTATASALRWLLAFLLVASSMALWWRTRLPKLLRELPVNATRDLRLLAVVLCALPIIGLSIYPANLAFDGIKVRGPSGECLFQQIGNSVSYVVPLMLVAIVFIGHAMRERSAGWAFAASGICNLTITLSYALAVATSHQTFDGLHLVRLVQLNVITAAVFGLAWLTLRAMLRLESGIPNLLGTQIALAILGVACLILPAAAALFVAPVGSLRFVSHVGNPLGWLAVGATIAAAARVWGRHLEQLPAALVANLLAAGGLMIAFAAANWDSGNWLSFHAMMVCAIATTAGTLSAALIISRRSWGTAQALAPALPDLQSEGIGAGPIALQYFAQRPTTGVSGLKPEFLLWITIQSGWVVLLALRAMLGDPQQPWWSSTSMLAVCLVWLAASWWAASPGLLYAAGFLLNLGATLWWFSYPVADLLAINGAVLGIFGTAAMVLHFQLLHRTGTPRRGPALPFHRFAGAVSTAIVVLVALRLVVADASRFAAWSPTLFDWAALASAILLAFGTLADPASRSSSARLYVLGLCAAAMGVSQLRLPPEQIPWGHAVVLGGFVLVSCCVYRLRARIMQMLSALGIPAQASAASAPWFAWASVALSILVICLAVQVDFAFRLTPYRVTAAAAALVQLLGLVLCAQSDNRDDVRRRTILLSAAAAVTFAWAWMSPATAIAVERVIAVMVALTVVAVACGMRALREPGMNSPWGCAVRATLPMLVMLWALSVVGTIALEFAVHGASAVQMSPVAVAAVLTILPASAVVAILLALRRSSDPLGVPERFRSGYVYAGETLLAITFAHLRLTMPWLFSGFFAQYWPLIVIAIAFASVGLGELLRRRKTVVLSEPLLNTGIFLPLLAIVGFGLAPSRVELSNLLFVIGFFYAVLSAGRRSFMFGVLAALAANGGLWALLYRNPELRFLVHPQLWLIPVAVSVMMAAQLNRDRLTPETMKSIRYVCLIIVYISSTADIFLNGVRDHPWLPLVLAVLSVSGVILGMLFRLRAFLFLGTGFLAVAILTMIYYAWADLRWTWIWYASGIAMGAAMFSIFALFEKKRPKMLALVEGLKHWQ
jgi:hypothetical protein